MPYTQFPDWWVPLGKLVDFTYIFLAFCVPLGKSIMIICQRNQRLDVMDLKITGIGVGMKQMKVTHVAPYDHGPASRGGNS